MVSIHNWLCHDWQTIAGQGPLPSPRGAPENRQLSGQVNRDCCRKTTLSLSCVMPSQMCWAYRHIQHNSTIALLRVNNEEERFWVLKFVVNWDVPCGQSFPRLLWNVINSVVSLVEETSQVTLLLIQPTNLIYLATTMHAPYSTCLTAVCAYVNVCLPVCACVRTYTHTHTLINHYLILQLK